MKPHMSVQKWKGSWWTTTYFEDPETNERTPDRQKKHASEKAAMETAEKALDLELIDNLHIFDKNGKWKRTRAIEVVRPDLESLGLTK